MNNAVLPISFRPAALNSLPMSNAINPNAMLDKIFTAPSSLAPVKPKPIPPKTYGPTIIPAIRNDVTSGSIIPFLPIVYLKALVMSRPADNANAVLRSKSITITIPFCFYCLLLTSAPVRN